MRSIIIMALLMPAAASAHLKPTDSQQFNNETQQKVAMLRETSTSKKLATDMDTIRTQTPETKSAAKTKKANIYKNSNRHQRMNFLTFIMMLKDGKQ